MAQPPVKLKEGFECPNCMAPVRPGTTECKACGLPVPRPLTARILKAFLVMVLALVAITFLYFWALPNVRANSAIALVRSQEQSFIDQAMRTIQDKQFRFLGWEAQVFGSKLVLVTFTYVDPAAGASGYLAVWWAVDLDRGAATRVKSMQDFADNYLLKLE